MTDFRDGPLNGSPPPADPNNHHGFDFGNITSTPQKHAPERGPASPPRQSIDPPPTVSTTSNGNGTATSGVADFFSPEVFQIVLHNPATAHQLLKFSQARMSGENMEFLERVRNLI
jgi:phototropin